MKKFARLISLLLVLCMVLSVVPAMNIASAAEANADLWVDPVNGNDTNDGTTEQTALKTIDAAKTKAAALSANGNVVVILKAGTYDATETIQFGAAESGKNGNTITYRAEAGKTVLISGGEQLDGWTLHDAAHNIYVADIPKGAELTRQFYVNGQPQPMASMELTPKEMSVFTSSGYRSEIISSENSTHYLTVDLGEGKLVSSVTLYGDSEASPSTGKALGFPKNFTIQTSADGRSWTTEVTETNFTAPNALGGVEFNFSSTAARYIKIEATKLGNPGSNSQSGGTQHRLAFSEVQVGFTSKANSVNLGIAQHVDLTDSIASASNVSLTTNNPYVVTIGSTAAAVGAVIMTADAAAIGTLDNIKIQATTDGTNWQTVYSKNGYTWKLNNTFAINPVAATKIRIISAQNITISELKVHKPAELSGTVTATGANTNKLMDGKFDGGFASTTQTSAIYNGDIVVNLGSVQDVGGIRLYPTYNGTKVTGYMTSARVQVSTDGVTYHTVLELPEIQTPTGGAQILVMPKGYKAQYVKIQPLMLTGEGQYSLQLDELDIVPSTIEGINAEDDKPNYVTKKNYNKVSWNGATPVLGYYADVNNMTGTPTPYATEDETVAGEEAACIIRGTEGSRGYTGLFQYSELVANGGIKVPAFYVTLASATTFNALELMTDNDIWGGPLSFSVEAYDGTKWVKIVNDSNPGWSKRQNYANTYEFDAITATAVRVLAYDLATMNGAVAGTSDTETRFILDELTLYNVTEHTYIEEEILDSETTVYDKVNLSYANVLGFGYYKANDMDNIVSYNQGNGANMFDGNYENYGSTQGQQYQWMPDLAGSNIPALLLNVTRKNKPATINTIELAVREDGLCAPYDFEIQVTTSADKDNWITVAKGEEVEWKTGSKAVYKFPEMDVYKVRLVATNLTPASILPREEWKGDVTTYLQICEFSLYNIYDPENPIAIDAVSQGEGTSGSVTYDAKGATSSSSTSNYNPNRAVDGFIEPVENAGLNVSSDARYNFSYLKHPEHVELHSLYIWYHRIQHITGASGDGLELYMEGGLGTQKGEALMPTWLSNDYMFIDVPGEWYIDRYEGKIYYMAEDDMDGVEAYLPVTETIVEMEYASNIKFEGITFSHTSFTYPSENEYLDQQANAYYANNTYIQVPGGIDLLGCTNVVFDGCEISNMGTAGIRIRSDGDGASDGCQVINSLIRDISYNGITIGQIHAHHGYQSWMLVKNTTIRNNYVTRIGLDMYDSVGIYAAYTYGTVIDHNEVAYTPYTGISMGWGWDQEEEGNTAALTEVGNNEITNNIIHDVCKTNRDGGAIYTLGYNGTPSKISGNYIYNFGDGGPNGEIGIYLDEGSAYFNVNNNVLAGTGAYWMQMYFNNIHDNTWRSNYYTSNLRSRNYTTGNSVSGSTSINSVSSNSSAAAIAAAAGLTDTSIKEGQDKGFWFRHDIYQEYWTSSDYARYIDDAKGWYNVRISGQVGRTYYNSVDKVVTIVMPKGTNLSALSLQYSNESGWNVTPGTGTTQNFTNPVTYTVTTAGGGTSMNWTVNVIEEPDNTVAPQPPVNDDPTVETIPTQAPTEPTPPEDMDGYVYGTVYEIVSPSSLEAQFGVYTDRTNKTGFSDGQDGYCLTDGWYYRSAYSGSTQTPNHGLVVAIITLDEATTIGGVEIVGDNISGWDPTQISIEAYVGGSWVEVVEKTTDVMGSTRTKLHTFDPVQTTQIRVLVHSAEKSNDQVHIGEISLYEAKTDKTVQKIDLSSRLGSNDGTNSTGAKLVDNNKSNYFLGTYAEFDLTNNGEPTEIDKFALFHLRPNGSNVYPNSVKILIKKTADGSFESIGTFNTNWGNFYPMDSLFVTFDQTYEAYSLRMEFDRNAYAVEFELYQYVKQTVQEDVELPIPDLTEVSVTSDSITVTATPVTGGTLQYRIDGGEWQTSGTFTGLSPYTKYTVEAMYVGGTGYKDSLPAILDTKTAKIQLPDVTGLAVVSTTEDSITVNADTHPNGTLQFRINKNGSWTSWNAGNTFTGLTENTTYTVEARYYGKSPYKTSATIISIQVTTKKPDTILVGASYSVHLVEPWALRTYVQFSKNTEENLIPVSSFTDYGAYAIIGSKFSGTTAEELMADKDAVKYTKALENITAEGTTLTFDFYEGLYSYNLDETIYWVAYYEDASGKYVSSVQVKSITEVANSLLEDSDVEESEKNVLTSMMDLNDAVIALRGEDASLGHIYPAGAANPGTLGERNKGYLFGTSFKMKLIEPWGVRVRVLIRENAPVVDGKAVYADYESASDYGLIFFHDKNGKYDGTMTAGQMKAETEAKVFSKQNGNAVIHAGGVTAVYDHKIYTYQLDSELYCLPYIVIDGNYYYPSNAICWNLLDEMVEFSERKDLDPKETAVFNAILTMYENVQEHRKQPIA